MLASVHSRVWSFDAEWVPDALAGRLLYGVEESDEGAVFQAMWERAGATEANPTPFLKLVQSRVVSIAMVERRLGDRGVALRLTSLPEAPGDAAQRREAPLLDAFLGAVGRDRPQLVGFNSRASDLLLMVQRATILGLHCPELCERPERSWESADYFAPEGDLHVDLMQLLGGARAARPSLHELSVQSGFPGKLDVDGADVARLWLAGEWARIVAYNEFDAVSTYLLWLRVAHFAGHFSRAAYAEEQELLRELLVREAAGARPHFARYLDEWNRLRDAVAARERDA